MMTVCRYVLFLKVIDALVVVSRRAIVVVVDLVSDWFSDLSFTWVSFMFLTLPVKKYLCFSYLPRYI
jgi:hypothetical protein